MMNLLKPYLRPGTWVLDAGCGSGFFSGFFLEQGCVVSSLDFSEASLAATREKTGGRCKEYVCEDLLGPRCLEGREGSIDLVFTDGLFEHFSGEDQAKIIGRFRQLLAVGGVLATFVPNRYSWWQILRPFVMPGIREKPFTLQGLLELHAGMEVLAVGGFNVLPFALSPDRQCGRLLGMLLFCIACPSKPAKDHGGAS
jgi:SAM-dependent methyltransferase